MSINERIKQVRQELHLSQAKFAEKISISNGYIASIELGNRNVNDRILKLICITFNVRENWLKNGSGSMFCDETNKINELTIINIFRQLNPEFQGYVLNQMNELLKLQTKNEENN